LWERLAAAASSVGKGTLGSRTGRTLVLVTLYGGNDGLNTVVPYTNPAYGLARGILAVDPSSVLELGEGFGLHPAMPRFHKLWTEKKLAIVHGVGFANPNYSHFESMDIWQTALPNDPASSGWLGRWLDATGSNPLRAVGIGPTTPTALVGANVQAAAIPVGGITLPGTPLEQAAYAKLGGTFHGEPFLLDQAAASCADLLQVNKTLGPILTKTANADPLHLKSAAATSTSESNLALSNGGGGLGAANTLATQLSVVANLILSDAPTEVYSVDLGGFDTHYNQAATQDTLLAEVDQGISAFVDAMSTTTRGRGTVVLVYTEFGRRVGGNASLGTDHGWANVVFVAGHQVKGGTFYGEPPSLTALNDGNIVYNTDFRTVYSTVLDQVLGVDAKTFLQGTFKPVEFL
ncbi:MAG: DUF1501 domain-containing protein, partial [Acidimicrobiales bacterium]